MPMSDYETKRMLEDTRRQEQERVEQQRAYERQMKGTWAQNADLERQLRGTFTDRFAADQTMQGTWRQRDQASTAQQQRDIEAANWRAMMSDATSRRGQDLQQQTSVMNDKTTRRGQDLGQDQALMQNITSRRGQDVQREIGGWNYPIVKQYDEMGQVVGEGVMPYHFGKPVGGSQAAAAPNPARWKGVKGDQNFLSYYDTLTPEQKNATHQQIYNSGNTDLLGFLNEANKKRAAGQNPAAKPSTAQDSLQRWLQGANTTGERMVQEREQAGSQILSDAGKNLQTLRGWFGGSPGPGLQVTTPEVNPAFKRFFASEPPPPPATVGQRLIREPIPAPDQRQAKVRRPIPGV